MVLTQKQETFCLAYIETGNASEAYRRAYNTGKMKSETITKRASELLADGDVAGRLEDLRAPVREKAQLTLESHLVRLEYLSQRAERAHQYSAAITAETNRGRAAGFYTEKVDHTTKGDKLPTTEPAIINVTVGQAQNRE